MCYQLYRYIIYHVLEHTVFLATASCGDEEWWLLPRRINNRPTLYELG